MLGLIYLFGTAIAVANAAVEVYKDGVKYQGFSDDGIEYFLGVPYAQDTGGGHRFKPPRPHVPSSGSTVDATKPGAACKST